MSNSRELSLPPNGGDEDSAGQELNWQIVLTALRYWWKLAVPTALVLATAVVVAVLFLSKPKYTASVWLIIREKPEYLLNPQVMEDPRKFVMNQMELMRSPPVIDPVVSKPAVLATPELAGGDAAERLRRLLKIQAKGQSDFFVIEFTSVVPKQAALIVNEIANAYLMLQDRDLSLRMDATIVRLEKQRAEQQQAIERLRAQVQEKTKSLTGVDPFANRSAAAQAAAADTFGPLQSQIVAAEIDQAMTAAQAEAEEELLKKQVFDVPEAELERYVQKHPEVIQWHQYLAHTQSRLREHERVSVNLERNAQYQQLLKQASADKAQFEKRLAALRPLIKTELEQQARLARTDQVTSLRKSFEAKALTVGILRERLKEERAKLQSYKGETVELEFLRSDYDSAARVFEAINSRIVAMRLEQHAPPRVLLFKEAAPPEFPAEAIPYRRLTAAGLAAFLLPFGVAVGVELLLRRVSSRRQLEAASRMPVLAEVTELPRIPAAQAGGRQLINREMQLFEESIDGLRTRLLLGEQTQRLQTIAVTSAVSREGKTSVAIQLALSLARSSEAPTLLIDADLRCPEVHRLFEIDRAPGLAELLQGTCSQRAAIETEFGPALHVLSAGQLAAIPHKLLGGEAFPRLLAELSKRYRYIVLDTPPILAACEALIIARHADQSVVCARRDFSRLDQVAEAYDRLQAAGARVAGTVLNGISPRSFAYRYGSYYFENPLENEAAMASPRTAASPR